MTEEGKAAESPVEMRGNLVARLAVAGGLVAVLLAVLAFFDYLASSDEQEAKVYTKPVPVSPKKEVSQPVTPVTVAPEPQEIEKPAPSAAEDAPKSEPPPKPEVAARPAAPMPEAKLPAKPVSMGHTAPAAAAEAPAAPMPASNKASEGAATAPQPLTATRLFSGYMLRAGVFNSARRAEELHARLTLNGIPSTLEARVQVGPFKTREEAEAAREKMLSLGIDPVLIPPRMARR